MEVEIEEKELTPKCESEEQQTGKIHKEIGAEYIGEMEVRERKGKAKEKWGMKRTDFDEGGAMSTRKLQEKRVVVSGDEYYEETKTG